MGYHGIMYTHFIEPSTIETVSSVINSLGQSQYNGGSTVDLTNNFYISQYNFSEKNKTVVIPVTPDKNGNITLYFDGIENRLIEVDIQEKDSKRTEDRQSSVEVTNNKTYTFLGFNKSKEYVVTLGANSKYMWGENKGRFIIY